MSYYDQYSKQFLQSDSIRLKYVVVAREDRLPAPFPSPCAWLASWPYGDCISHCLWLELRGRTEARRSPVR